jgi:alkyldihydroxyacetonephosphate synthase
MKRWNGWGDETIDYPLTPEMMAFIVERIGRGTPPRDAKFADVAAMVPPSRLPPHALVTDSPDERVRHSRGQSLGDWIALRGGCDLTFPDGVAYPASPEAVRDLIQYAYEHEVHLIPYGGGTSVVGHINPLQGDKPVLTVDLSRLSRLIYLDKVSNLATFGAGITGIDLEAALRAQGFTLGHFPFEYSTLGGWIAARSKGQQSLHYGGIERLFAGGTVETPLGALDLPPFPNSAAGPDLREITLGSEGRMGIITEATVRITPLPEREIFRAAFFATFASGMAAIRELAQARLPLSMLRLSNAIETQTSLALAGHKRLLTSIEWYLAKRGIGDGKAMLIFAVTGAKAVTRSAGRAAAAIIEKHGGAHLGAAVGAQFGKQWAKSRFYTPYLRNTLWERGFAVDTVETATTWDKIPETLNAVEAALRNGLNANNERVHVFTHLSHVYPTGASIYTTYLFRIPSDPAETLRRWKHLKGAASEAMVAHGSTISHQHGVGIDHMPYLAAEKGEQGMAIIRQLYGQFDPKHVMNPGKLFE